MPSDKDSKTTSPNAGSTRGHGSFPHSNQSHANIRSRVVAIDSPLEQRVQSDGFNPLGYTSPHGTGGTFTPMGSMDASSLEGVSTNCSDALLMMASATEGMGIGGSVDASFPFVTKQEEPLQYALATSAALQGPLMSGLPGNINKVPRQAYSTELQHGFPRSILKSQPVSSSAPKASLTTQQTTTNMDSNRANQTDPQYRPTFPSLGSFLEHNQLFTGEKMSKSDYSHNQRGSWRAPNPLSTPAVAPAESLSDPYASHAPIVPEPYHATRGSIPQRSMTSGYKFNDCDHITDAMINNCPIQPDHFFYPPSKACVSSAVSSAVSSPTASRTAEQWSGAQVLDSIGESSMYGNIRPISSGLLTPQNSGETSDPFSNPYSAMELEYISRSNAIHQAQSRVTFPRSPSSLAFQSRHDISQCLSGPGYEFQPPSLQASPQGARGAHYLQLPPSSQPHDPLHMGPHTPNMHQQDHCASYGYQTIPQYQAAYQNPPAPKELRPYDRRFLVRGVPLYTQISEILNFLRDLRCKIGPSLVELDTKGQFWIGFTDIRESQKFTRRVADQHPKWVLEPVNDAAFKQGSKLINSQYSTFDDQILVFVYWGPGAEVPANGLVEIVKPLLELVGPVFAIKELNPHNSSGGARFTIHELIVRYFDCQHATNATKALNGSREENFIIEALPYNKGVETSKVRHWAAPTQETIRDRRSDPYMSPEDRDRSPATPDRSPVRVTHVITASSVLNGSDSRTTVMLKNIPNGMRWDDLKKIVDDTSCLRYDFLYLRMDFEENQNVGYAFVNFITARDIIPFMLEREGNHWPGYDRPTEKIAEISYATSQGKPSLIEKFRNSPVMLDLKDNRPKLFHTTGPDAGSEAPFPPINNFWTLAKGVERSRKTGLYRVGRSGGGSTTRNRRHSEGYLETPVRGHRRDPHDDPDDNNANPGRGSRVNHFSGPASGSPSQQ